MIGAMAHTVVHWELVASAGEMASSDMGNCAAAERLVRFLAAGFLAPGGVC